MKRREYTAKRLAVGCPQYVSSSIFALQEPKSTRKDSSLHIVAPTIASGLRRSMQTHKEMPGSSPATLAFLEYGAA